MLNYYQPYLFPFLKIRREKAVKKLNTLFFISFEDCFWNLLDSQKIKRGSTILFPNFYCLDVIENTKLHGYKAAFYNLNSNFQISTTNLDICIKKHSPSVIILFHACGITNNILKNHKYIHMISKKILIVEDSVQKLINPNNIEIISDNHVIIDSLRKVTPLPGSFIYSTKNVINALKIVHTHSEMKYIVMATIYFLIFRVVLLVSYISHSMILINIAHKKLLKKHDDLIGDNQYGHFGLPIIPFLHKHINFEKIEKKKNEQVQLYIKTLTSLKLKDPWYFIDISSKDYKNLHVYPLGLKVTNETILEKIENTLKENRMPIWFKFTDSPWNKEQSVLFLPLGFHISNDEIIKACKVLQSIQLH